MLIKTIIMLLRKNTLLLCAYCTLTVSAFAIVACDAHRRSEILHQAALAAPAKIGERLVPVPFAPLSQSPFPEARPESNPAASPEHDPAPPSVYFLKVAVQVDSGDGPLSFDRGSEVRLIRQQDGKLLVTRDGTDFLVEKTQVTEDRSTVAALARSSS
jgi:hypothetical protein